MFSRDVVICAAYRLAVVAGLLVLPLLAGGATPTQAQPFHDGAWVTLAEGAALAAQSTTSRPEFLSQHPDLRPFIADASSFIVGGGYLYWTLCTVPGPRSHRSEAAPDAPQTGYLRRWPTAGGRVVTLTEQFDCSNTNWAADETGLYYYSGGFVMRRSTADPFTPYYVMFAQNASVPISSLLLDASYVYWLGQHGWIMRTPKLRVIQPDDPRYIEDREFVVNASANAYSLMLGEASRLFWFANNTLFSAPPECADVCTPTNHGAEAGGSSLINATLDGSALPGSWTYPLWVRGSAVRGRYCRPTLAGPLQCTFGSEYTAPTVGGNTYLVGRLAASPTQLFWVENYQICVPGGFCTVSGEGQLMAWPLNLSSDPYPIAARNSGGASFFISDQGADTQVDRGWVYFRTSAGIARLRTDAPPVQPDLAVHAIEVTQGIQNPTIIGDPTRTMDVPLVAYKPTIVRVYGRTLGGPRANNVTARLRISRNDGAPISIDLRPDNGAVAFPLPGGVGIPDRSQLGQSWQFTLPWGWTNWGNATLTAIVNDNRLGGDPSPANNQATVGIYFNRKAPICIVFIPIRTSQAGDVFAPPLRAQLDFSVAHAERLLPAEQIRAGWRQSDIAELEARFGIPPWEYGPYELDDDSTKILMSLWWRDQLSDDPDECDNANAETHYVGVAHPMANGKNGSSWNGHNQMWFRLPPTSTWTDTRAPTLAHELGHNYGRDHVDCPVNDPEDPDRNYPFPTCQLDYDNNFDRHWGLLNLGGALQTIAPTAAGDLMSYAHRLPTPLPRFTSSYSWFGLFHSIPDGLTAAKSVPGPAVSPDAPRLSAATSVVLLTGAVNIGAPTQSELSHAWVMPTAAVSGRMVDKWQRTAARAWVKPLPGAKVDAPYHIRLLDAAGAVLDDREVTLLDDTHAAPLKGFGLTFPAPARPPARIVLLNGATELVSRAIGANAPIVTLLQPAGGETIDRELNLVWTASDADVGDRLLFSVQYSPDNGLTWRSVLTDIPNVTGTDRVSIQLRDARTLSASTTGGLIRVAASDGYHTSFSVSAPFTVPNRTPEPVITSPTASDHIPPGGVVRLQGTATDAEDGTLAESALVWSVTGPIPSTISGQGAQLPIAGLGSGVYEATLTASDTAGNPGSTTSSFTVAPLAIPVAAAPTLDGTCDDDVYANALRLPLRPYADGAQSSVLLSRTGAHLWACFAELRRTAGTSPGTFVILRADVNASRATTPQADDYEFTLTEDGVGTTGVGNGASFARPGPGGMDGRVAADAATWSAELRLDAGVLGNWSSAIGLAVGQGSVSAAGDDYLWPYRSLRTNPSTWATTALGALPQISGVSPISATVNGRAFSLTVDGANFASGATVQWGGADKPTTVVSPTQLRADIATADLAVAGEVAVRVINPGLSATPSNEMLVTVNNPTPMISGATLNGTTLTVMGADFVPGATVAWNGVAQPTTFGDGSRLEAAIAPSLIPLAGQVTVVVTNPTPSIAPSNIWPLAVGAPPQRNYRLYMPLVSRGRADTVVRPATVIYEDALASDWQDWSWDTGVDLAATAPTHTGQRAISVIYRIAWAGLSLRAPTPLDGTTFTAVTFWGYGGAGGTRIDFYTEASDNGPLSPMYPVALPAGVWTQVTVPLSALGAPTAIARLTWQESTGAAQPTYYLDDIRLVASAGSATQLMGGGVP